MTEVPPELREYTGREPRIDDPVQRMGYQLSMAGSVGFYGPETCDWALKAAQIVLNEKTAEYVYSGFSPTTVSYRRGSRPMLEKLAAALCTPEMSDRQKVLAVLDYVYRGYRRDHVDLFGARELVVLNAQEEEIPKLGKVSCECHSRLTICLCNVIGLPARYVSVYGGVDPDRDFAEMGGHTMTEVFLDGRWSVFDSDWGFFCQLDDGSVAGMWEVLQDPDLPRRQPEWIYDSFGNNRQHHLDFQSDFLSPHRVIAVSNYSADDWRHYDWNWVLSSHEQDDPRRRKVDEEKRRLRERTMRECGLG